MIKRLLSAAWMIPCLLALIVYQAPLLYGLVCLGASLLLCWELLAFEKNALPPQHRYLVYISIIFLFSLKIYFAWLGILNAFNQTLPLLIFGFLMFLCIYECRAEDFKKTYLRVSFPLFTFIYTGVIFSYLFDLRYLHLNENRAYLSPDLGAIYVIYVFTIPWMYDAGGYFIGRTWGRKKIGLTASPNKSWAGFYGGLAFALLAHGLFISSVSYFFSTAYATSIFVDKPLFSWLLPFLLALIGQGGDLFESALKRSAERKDSSKLIAGHGGVFDAIDSVIPNAFFLYIIIESYG